jgi:hypothetical protein
MALDPEMPEEMDSRPKMRRPFGLYLVAGAYVCAVLFVFGGGIHNWGGSFGFFGIWLLAAGNLSSVADLLRPVNRRKGKAGLVAAAILLAAIFLFSMGC